MKRGIIVRHSRVGGPVRSTGAIWCTIPLFMLVQDTSGQECPLFFLPFLFTHVADRKSRGYCSYSS